MPMHPMPAAAPLGGTDRAKPTSYLMAIALVAVAVVLAYLARQLLPHASLSLVFLTSVLIVAARAGLGPALVASVLSFLAFNFFFTPPELTFQVDDDGDVSTLLFFLVMAGLSGNLAARMHREMEKSRASLAHLSELYEFGRGLSAAADQGQVLETLAHRLAVTLGRPVVVLCPDGGGSLKRQARAGPPAQVDPDPAGVAALWTETRIGPSRVGGWTFFPLSAHRSAMGLVGVEGLEESEGPEVLARSLCDQAALALDRVLLVNDLSEARLVSETEQLRSALLSSVSHDLRTPLASIIGSATSLLDYGEAFTADNRRELMATVLEESRRLDRYIQNLLDMTRLGQGDLQLQRDWVDLGDLVASALGRLGQSGGTARADVRIAPDLPLLWVHGALVEQALVNLLDNAVRFSAEDGRITVEAQCEDAGVRIQVCDQGPGIPPADREKVFDMFYTACQRDRASGHGTGLGLAICKGLIGAHGGKVSAHEGKGGRGTCMRIWLPAPGEAPEGS